MLDQIKIEMDKDVSAAIKILHHQLSKIRTGRASASVLDGITIDYYGVSTPLNQIGQISTPEARLLQIQPFDKTTISAIEKAIFSANLGMTPSNDGNVVRIPFPKLTEDKRKEIVKGLKKVGEDAKVAIRNVRRDQNEVVKKAEKAKTISEDESKKIQAEVQVITDKYIKQIDAVIDVKEKEVMTV